jgi:hypothetical protein
MSLILCHSARIGRPHYIARRKGAKGLSVVGDWMLDGSGLAALTRVDVFGLTVEK